MTPALRVGLVGLGHMGAPMGARLLQAGFGVTAFDVRTEAVEAAVRSGARGGASAADCAARSDVLITMLPGAADVEAVLLGDGGALAAMGPGSVLVDMGTGEPELARRLAEAGAARGVGVLDAPVTDAHEVQTGRLQVFAGGDAEVLARVRPVLDVLGTVRHVGPAGTGQVVKLLINLQWFVHAAAAAEALLAGMRAGVDLEALHASFAAGPARTSFIEREALEVLRGGGYGERFPLPLVLEELRAATGLAREAGVPAAMAEATLALHEQALRRLGPEAGEMGVLAYLEAVTGTRLRF